LTNVSSRPGLEGEKSYNTSSRFFIGLLDRVQPLFDFATVAFYTRGGEPHDQYAILRLC
jgi:hypothetical protein